MTTKICSCCKKELPLNIFVKDKYTATGYKSWCKPCANEKSRKYHASIPKEAKNKKMKEWRDANREYWNGYLRSLKNNNSDFELKGRPEGISREEARCNLKNWKRQYDQENKDGLREYRKIYYSKNEKVQMRRERNKKWINSNPSVKIAQTLRRRLRQALETQSVKKIKSASEMLGCSIDDFIKYIESKWEAGMNWSNYGSWIHGEEPKWNFDHIRPCISYCLEKLSEQKDCFNYKNIRPVWGNENYKKRDKIIDCPWGYDFQI